MPILLPFIHVASASAELIYTDPEKWVEDNLEALAETVAHTAPNDAYFTPFCVEYPPYGVHFIDKILGADVFFQDGQWYNRPLKNAVGTLAASDLERDETWSLAKRAALAFVAQGVKLPLFGMPTLSSALNIGINIYGQEILVAMLENPDAARRDLSVINDAIMRMHSWYIANVPQTQLQPVISWHRTQPPGHGQLCGCSTQLISAAHYAELVAPLDNALLGCYPNGGMIHLCGAHTQHIPTFRAMPNLKALEMNDRAALDLPHYHAGLRDDQLIYLNCFADMPPARALEITNGGDRLVILNFPR